VLHVLEQLLLVGQALVVLQVVVLDELVRVVVVECFIQLRLLLIQFFVEVRVVQLFVVFSYIAFVQYF